MSRSRRLGFGAVAWVVLIAACACDSKSAGQPRGLARSVVPSSQAVVSDILAGVPETLRPLPGPLSPYLITSRERAVLEYAQALLIERCMRERGFAYPVAKFEDIEQFYRDFDDLGASRLYGLVSLDDARKYGFGDPPLRGASRAAMSLSPEAEFALTGPLVMTPSPGPDGRLPQPGCLLVAERQLLASDDVKKIRSYEGPLAERLRTASGLEAAASDASIKVAQDWAGCMKTKGYDIPDGVRPMNSEVYRRVVKPHKAGELAFSEDEKKLAVAAVECAVTVDRVRRMQAQRDVVAARMVEQNALALQEEREMFDRAIARALEFGKAGAA